MQDHITELSSLGRKVEDIPVVINYDIIRLFSEGLYRSPHKAIEELVSNAYDADAERVHVLLPDSGNSESSSLAPLWVIDDGSGMSAEGFRQLWRVADSAKNGAESGLRPPIGQFGIGKLASYVLAWKLTHLSRTGNGILLTTMDFRRVSGRQHTNPDPVEVTLREVDESAARTHLAEIEARDPEAWDLMFGSRNRANSWTAAALSDFKDLYGQLSAGKLRWVLSTGLPLLALPG